VGDDTLAVDVGRTLGGDVVNIRRLSGGASRITSALELVTPDGKSNSLILQRDRGGPSPFALGAATESRLLRAARDANVPVATVIGLGTSEGKDWLAVERLNGETIPRRILRDDRFESARQQFSHDCGTALARIHAIDPTSIEGVPAADHLAQPMVVADTMHLHRPVLELSSRWLALHEPTQTSHALVHGDFRMGNLLVDDHGLRGVLDWELAHGGDPAEDLGWLCARSWRFGGLGRVGGIGSLDDLLGAYREAGGDAIDTERVTWWEAFASVKWAVICALQASAHLSGTHRSVELAAIGRRVCESEWDLVLLLALVGDAHEVDPERRRHQPTPFGRPTALELVTAVRERLDEQVNADEGGYSWRVTRNALQIAERELELGESFAENHRRRLSDLGAADDESLCRALREGAFDEELVRVGQVLAHSAREQLLVANPNYLRDDGAA
jgi:aminoglycoside phosphotransferase (APT) family kinase protein